MADKPFLSIFYFDPDEPLATELVRRMGHFASRARVEKRRVRSTLWPIGLANLQFAVLIASEQAIQALGRSHLEEMITSAESFGNIVVLSDDRSLRDRAESATVTMKGLRGFYGAERSRRFRELSMILDEWITEAEDRSDLRFHNQITFPEKVPPLPTVLFLRISEIGIPRRVCETLVDWENITIVGDLIQRTEPELLRIPNFGRRSLEEVNVALARCGLRLGMDIPDWPPPDLKRQVDRVSLAHTVRGIHQAPLGAIFQPAADVLIVDSRGDETDEQAAARSIVGQLHQEVLRKAMSFAAVAPRVDNQVGWKGINSLCDRLVGLLNRPTSDIPEVLGSLYSATLELGSFQEMDTRISPRSKGFALPLDPEVRRPLEDLLGGLAPWVRSFPTIRALDDEAALFRTKSSLVAPSSGLLRIANEIELILSEVREALDGLLEAADRGEFQGLKASHRGVLSVRNLVVAAATVISTVMLGAVGSELAPHSLVAQRSARFLSEAETEVLEVIADLPQDLSLALQNLIKQMHESPVLPPTEPMVPRPTGDRPRRPPPE